MQGPVPVRTTTLRPIVRPGTTGLARLFTLTGAPVPVAAAAVVLIVAAISATFAGGLLFGPIAAVALVGGYVLACGAAVRAAAKNVVAGPYPKLAGRAIDGQGFQLLEDIDARFAYAETNIRELPTGIEWTEVGDDVRVLLWEAAEHAADLTTLDAEIHELRYAAPGTPQAALGHTLEEQRAAHWDILRGIQWEAETLARTAGNAAAAARVALARTGSLAALQRVTPSRRAIVAAGALAEARQRLELLAGVWAELDDSGTIAAERLDADRRKELGR